MRWRMFLKWNNLEFNCDPLKREIHLLLCESLLVPVGIKPAGIDGHIQAGLCPAGFTFFCGFILPVI